MQTVGGVRMNLIEKKARVASLENTLANFARKGLEGDAPVVYHRPRGLVGWLGLGRPRPPTRHLD